MELSVPLLATRPLQVFTGMTRLNIVCNYV
jgi:hypothetical protein